MPRPGPGRAARRRRPGRPPGTTAQELVIGSAGFTESKVLAEI
ncbi:hypothetical protein OG229_16810 [Streptomyces platensis]|nr:hypothetical protein OG229_16810 [Streptomyces platensis]